LLKKLNKNLQFHIMFEICSDLFKTVLKIYYFCRHSKKAKKLPNGQTIHYISGKQFQKRPRLADLAFKKAKWQPCPLRLE